MVESIRGSLNLSLAAGPESTSCQPGPKHATALLVLVVLRLVLRRTSSLVA